MTCSAFAYETPELIREVQVAPTAGRTQQCRHVWRRTSLERPMGWREEVIGVWQRG
jgi:hypothetical protein